MTLQMGRNNLKGFDTAQALSTASAAALFAAGYRFALRYVPRTIPGHSYDLSAAEKAIIHHAGLALMIVQHVEKDEAPGWEPTVDKGAAYGYAAGEAARAVGYAPGATLWLDLEGVNARVDTATVIAYANNWHGAVKAAGFSPGVYVGFSSRISAQDLYRRLRFDRYWSAYNLNADEHPAVRDVCMKQSKQVTVGGVTLDPDEMVMDRLGGLPMLDAPEEWAV